jgi:RNase adapter protein RapZ
MSAHSRTIHLADDGMVRTVITTYGDLHGATPSATAPVISIDLRTALRNPADDESLIEMTGLDTRVREHVLNTPGAEEIVKDATARILAAYKGTAGRRQDAFVFCMGGRHRSVAIAEAIAERLRAFGHGTEVDHRDIDKPVIRKAKKTAATPADAPRTTEA